MKKLRVERQSGGIEEVECTEFVLSRCGLECFKHTTGNNNYGIPLPYLSYAIPAVDVRWVEEIVPDPRPEN